VCAIAVRDAGRRIRGGQAEREALMWRTIYRRTRHTQKNIQFEATRRMSFGSETVTHKQFVSLSVTHRKLLSLRVTHRELSLLKVTNINF